MCTCLFKELKLLRLIAGGSWDIIVKVAFENRKEKINCSAILLLFLKIRRPC